jgi:hypothetical protein
MESINPYAPTTLTPQNLNDQQLPKSKVTSVAVASRTIAGITLSGGLFGVGLVLVMFVASGRFDPAMLMVAGIAFGVGMLIAGIAGFVTVSILMGLFHSRHRNSNTDAPTDNPWTIQRVTWFAIISGSISGFASLAIPTGGASEALLWALLPGVVGAIGAYAMNLPCLRMLRQERLDWIANKSERPDPLAFESPSI